MNSLRIIIPRHHIFVMMGRVRVRDLLHRIAVWMAVRNIVTVDNMWDIHSMVIMEEEGEDVMGDIINNSNQIIIITFPRLHHNHNEPWYYPWHSLIHKLVNGARTLDR